MPLRLHNSLTRRIETFTPADPARVTMYLCGPTVYSYVHIGNARGPVVFDVLARLLRRKFPRLVYARNITDVDDKINNAAAEAGVPIAAVTGKYAAIYREDMAKLGVAPPDVEPLATQHIGQIIAMCESLIASGHAYAAEGHVLFDVAKFKDYGKLSGRSTDEMIAGARVEVAPYKTNPADFVLWKPSSPDLPGWDSPWGRGRPGWHIECSAMAAAHLGDVIDIHAGGNDLLFPHHENEIAQSRCAHGTPTFARYWLHNGMLTFDGAKMSKSIGNVRQLHALLDQHPPEALRYALLSAHYRQPLDWSDALIEQSIATLDRLYGTLRDLEDVEVLPKDEATELLKEHETLKELEAALLNDLNTPEALVAIAKLAFQTRQGIRAHKRISKTALIAGGAMLGLLQQQPEAWFKRGAERVDAAQVEGLIEARRAARGARDFARADAIRDELAAMGVAIEDGPHGTRWKVAER
ncbi:MAG: cysteine--tRNA ligase [Xanthomonadales bacterium]|nr:cysteine--tRNA ligase [Xanthomonadales bacterium]ODU94874.1 MAG: cysteine--tRNA ligase [Rhodanobacter sp. SCN 66-43]OJY82861.1 MAG: cysteine--tRNA ligase [Xanthomonadales bacterium 66-474]